MMVKGYKKQYEGARLDEGCNYETLQSNHCL